MAKKKQKRKPKKLTPKPNTNTSNADKLVLDGIELLHNNDLVEAENNFVKAMELEPHRGDTYGLIGVIALHINQIEIAIDYFRNAIERAPKTPEHYYNLALSLNQLSKFDESLESILKALELNPASKEAWNTLAVIHIEKSDWRQACDASQQAIELDQNFGQAWSNLCGALQELGQYDDALEAGLKAVEFNPDEAIPYYNLACTYERFDDFDNAIVNHLKCQKISPDFLETYINLSNCYTAQERYDETIQCLNTALQLDPNSGQAFNNLGMLYYKTGYGEKAIGCFNEAIRIDPDVPELHYNLSHQLLAQEDFEQGWQEHEYGSQTIYRGPIANCETPIWRGEPLAGKTIHVIAEQGVGEHILFSTMLGDLLNEGAKIIFECDDRLVPIYRRSIPEISSTNYTNPPEPYNGEQHVDYRILAGSLGQWFRPSSISFTPKKQFLTPDASLVAKCRDKYDTLGAMKTIGISWKSSNLVHSKRKNIGLEMWEPLFRIPGYQFISLQYGDVADDVRSLEAQTGKSIYIDPDISAVNSLEQSMAQICAVDHVITISNATAHLAGACGIRTSLLLKDNSMWHWFQNRSDCLWYDSLKVYRHQANESIELFMQNIAADLTS